MKAIGYYAYDGVICNSDGKCITQGSREDYLRFLLADTPDCMRFFYNLNHNVANILATIGMTQKEGERLINNGICYSTPYTIKYFTHKFFSVSYGGGLQAPFAPFANAAQYLHDKGLKVTETPDLEWALLRAKEAAEAGNQVLDVCRELNIGATFFATPVSAFFKARKLTFPTVDELPERVGELAYSMCNGGWVEGYQKGHFETAYDYDINSAYPSVMRNLPDVTKGKGKWVYDKNYRPDALLSVLRAELEIGADFHPVFFSEKRDMTRNFTPTGIWERVINKSKYEYIKNHHIGNVEIKEGWHWYPAGEIVYPFRETIDELYSYKAAADDDSVKRNFVKRILTGLYGKVLETHKGDFGDLFNPLYGAEIENQTHVKVAEFCLDAFKQGAKPISIVVDGVVLDKEINLPANDTIGCWRLSGKGACIAVGSGVVALERKNEGTLDTSGQNDFILRYSAFHDMLKANPELKEYKFERTAPVTVGYAIKQNKWDLLGKLQPFTKVVDVTHEEKRLYPEYPSCGGDLLKNKYASVPLDISLLMLGKV